MAEVEYVPDWCRDDDTPDQFIVHSHVSDLPYDVGRGDLIINGKGNVKGPGSPEMIFVGIQAPDFKSHPLWVAITPEQALDFAANLATLAQDGVTKLKE